MCTTAVKSVRITVSTLRHTLVPPWVVLPSRGRCDAVPGTSYVVLTAVSPIVIGISHI